MEASSFRGGKRYIKSIFLFLISRINPSFLHILTLSHLHLHLYLHLHLHLHATTLPHHLEPDTPPISAMSDLRTRFCQCVADRQQFDCGVHFDRFVARGRTCNNPGGRMCRPRPGRAVEGSRPCPTCTRNGGPGYRDAYYYY